MIPEDLKYTTDHEWARRLPDGRVEVGVTHYAQEQLGDITFVETPRPGAQIDAHGELGVVESVKAAADVFAPIGGTVSEVNPLLADSPELVNREPYGGGWICRLQPTDPAQLDNLMDAKQYAAHVAAQ